MSAAIHNAPLKRLRIDQWMLWNGRCVGILRGGDHPNGQAFEGKQVITTPIVDGPTRSNSFLPAVTTIVTRSGTVYELGEPAGASGGRP